MSTDLIRETLKVADDIERGHAYVPIERATLLRSLAAALGQAEERARIAETDLHVNYPEWQTERDRLAAALERAEKERDEADVFWAARRDKGWRNRDRLAAIAECDRLRAENERLRDREIHFARVLNVPDDGRYRNDWDSRLAAVLTENERLREALEIVSECEGLCSECPEMIRAALRVDDPDEAELRREADMPC